MIVKSDLLIVKSDLLIVKKHLIYIDVLYQVIIKFIPEVEPEPDEIAAIMEGRKDREENGTIPHEAINWD